MSRADIRNPTLRKVRNRGYTPIRYRAPDQVHHGWILKRGPKLLHVFLVGLGRRRLPRDEQRFVRELA